MRNVTLLAMPAALALAGQLFAGGFWLQLGNPEASPEARKQNAVLTVKAGGCHDPATASLTATATGVVNGARQVIDLKVIRLSEPGTFAIAQQWPNTGRWVIQLVATNGEQFTNTLVNAGPDGVDRLHARSEMKKFDGRAIEAMLSN
jgi:hypothetical protein